MKGIGDNYPIINIDYSLCQFMSSLVMTDQHRVTLKVLCSIQLLPIGIDVRGAYECSSAEIR